MADGPPAAGRTASRMDLPMPEPSGAAVETRKPSNKAVSDRMLTPAEVGKSSSSTKREPPIDIQKLQSNNAATWGDSMRQYEYGKRHVIHPDTLKGPEINIRLGMMKEQERVYDPLLQKFRDNDKEKGQRVIEERCRVQHLNRAKDIQLLRENNFDIINNASKLSGLGEDIADKSLKPSKVGKRKFPDSFYDYNIMSNLPVSIHHPDRPEARPLPAQKLPKQRMVPTFLQKDFNVVTNRYLASHSEKTKRDYELNLLEATAKHRTRNRMNPLTQQFLDPAEEERIAQFQEAHEVEQVHRALAQVPPTIKNRPSAFYSVINPDEVHNVDMVKWLDLAEDETKERYKNRYIDYHNKHVQDIRHDQITEERRMNKVAIDRFKEPVKRGFDIVTNEHHKGRNAKPLYLPYSHEPPGPWQRSKIGTIDTRVVEVAPAHVAESSQGATASAEFVPAAQQDYQPSPAPAAQQETAGQQPTLQSSSYPPKRTVVVQSSRSSAASSARNKQPDMISARSSARSSATSGAGRGYLAAAAGGHQPGANGQHQKSIQPANQPHAVQHNHKTVIQKMGIQPLNMTKVQMGSGGPAPPGGIMPKMNVSMAAKSSPPPMPMGGTSMGSGHHATSVPV
ncbi:unnamed protein product [Amoebophrya sp. A120]|nr:unnamed protein product [Amoebophrya sp. A120]|eukprot:GSA120T00014572001.1